MRFLFFSGCIYIGHIMAIKITVSDKVGFAVKGTLNDADGKEQPFNFGLTATRLDEEALNAAQIALVENAAKTGNHAAINDQLVSLITNWEGVRDESDAPLAYTPELLRTLLKAHRGLGLMAWRAYINESGAKEKN